MEALKIAAYLLNKVPSKAVPKSTFELWIGRKLSLRYLHVRTEVKIYNQFEKKLNSRTTNEYFIGYLEKSKRYRFYCPNHNTRIVEFGNVRFIENGKLVRVRNYEMWKSKKLECKFFCL